MVFTLLAKGIRESGGFNFLFSILSCFYFFIFERWPSMTDMLMTRPLNVKVILLCFRYQFDVVMFIL